MVVDIGNASVACKQATEARALQPTRFVQLCGCGLKAKDTLVLSLLSTSSLMMNTGSMQVECGSRDG